MSESANWQQFKTALENLGLDLRFPLVPEDDPRFPKVQAILAKFDGLPPSAPLPPGWEGNRPICWDGTLHGLLEYLHWGLFAKDGDDGYPRSGPIYHYCRVLRNAYRSLYFLGIRDFASGVPNARDVCDGMAQIQKLTGLVQKKIAESPAKTPQTVAVSCFATLSVPRWSDLGLGLRAGRHAIEVLAFVPCPTTGDRVRLKNAVPLQLTGKRWFNVLKLLADSSDGRTVRSRDIVESLHLITRTCTYSPDPDEDENDRSSTNNAVARRGSQIEEGLREDGRRAITKLRQTMADLGRKLRTEIHTDDKTPVFQSNGESYVAAFTVACLLTDDRSNLTFGKAT